MSGLAEIENQQVKHRLDGDDWEQPDCGDYGLPSAIASLLAAWYSGNRNGTVSWAENIAHRIFLPGCWDKRINTNAINHNLKHIAKECVNAINAIGLDYDDMTDAVSYEMSVANIGRLTNGSIHQDFSYIAPRIDAVAAEASIVLRHYWLGKLHEKNKRYNPESDYDAAMKKARTLGIDTSNNNYILQVIDLIPKP